MTTAIYAGSFDILTYGHLDIIRQTVSLFGNCSVLVADNNKKTCMFNKFERRDAIIHSTQDIKKEVNVTTWGGLTTDFNDWKTDRVLVRGIRNMTDMISEMSLASINEELSGLTTIFIPTANHYRNISSSLVKELLLHKKDVSNYCPKYVVDKLKDKLNA